MVERILEIDIENKEYKFEKILQIFIKKHEININTSTNLSTSFLSLFITLGITFIITYIGWNIVDFKNLFLSFWNGNWLFKFILFCIIFTLIYFTFNLTIKIGKLPRVEKFIVKILKIDNIQSNIATLNNLYLANLNPKKWKIKIKIDEEKGILELISISKK